MCARSGRVETQGSANLDPFLRVMGVDASKDTMRKREREDADAGEDVPKKQKGEVEETQKEDRAAGDQAERASAEKEVASDAGREEKDGKADVKSDKASEKEKPAADRPPALGFGAFASRTPFKSATALTEKADAASEKKATNDWASTGDAAIRSDGDNVVRMKKVQKPDVELTTGEEEEETVASARAKLYMMAENQVWKERGTGAIKLNVNEAAHSARLVMRLDAVLKLILNVKLFAGMQCHIEQERFIRVVAMEPEGLVHFAIKFGNASDAATFLARLKEHIPAAAAT